MRTTSRKQPVATDRTSALRFGGGVAGVVSEFLDYILMSAPALTLMEPIGLALWSLGAAYFF
jgi:hypothetical protein